MSYCKAIESMPDDSPHIRYHNEEYGFPLKSDNELFGRLILEINQAGLSWTTILNKADNFREAYSDFSVEKIAAYSEKDRKRLLQNAGIIRNKLKVNAAIHNARIIMEMQKSHGSFKKWLDEKHPLTKEEWVKLFKKSGFKFVGGEIINEFLMSSGYLPGAHDMNCPVYKEIEKLKPMWLEHP
ncbi:MAG: DNA-3-methyladenine glycosylase I [Cytophagales bacterium]